MDFSQSFFVGGGGDRQVGGRVGGSEDPLRLCGCVLDTSGGFELGDLELSNWTSGVDKHPSCPSAFWTRYGHIACGVASPRVTCSRPTQGIRPAEYHAMVPQPR